MKKRGLLRALRIVLLLGSLFIACSLPQDGDITNFYLNNQTGGAVNVVDADGKQFSASPIAANTSELLENNFGVCLSPLTLSSSIEVYTVSDSQNPILVADDILDWRQENRANSCDWYLDVTE